MVTEGCGRCGCRRGVGDNRLCRPFGLAAAEPAGIVYLVQGLPNGSVDLAIDGRTVAVAARPGAVVGPLKVPSGTRRLTARVPTANCCSTACSGSVRAEVLMSSSTARQRSTHRRR